jgi:hypothetical protein
MPAFQIRKIYFILFIYIPAITLSGCYTFSGASISPEIKSVNIAYFPNRASIVQPALSQAFTERLKDKFISQTSLRLGETDSDLLFEGYINDYQTQPIAIQGNETAAQNRLTITVFVKFVNQKDSKQNFETTFSRYFDYDSRLSLAAVEQDAITEINRQLVDDIFNRAVSNW